MRLELPVLLVISFLDDSLLFPSLPWMSIFALSVSIPFPSVSIIFLLPASFFSFSRRYDDFLPLFAFSLRRSPGVPVVSFPRTFLAFSNSKTKYRS